MLTIKEVASRLLHRVPGLRRGRRLHRRPACVATSASPGSFSAAIMSPTTNTSGARQAAGPLHVGRRHQVEAEIDMRRGAPMDLPVAGGDRGPKLNSTWERLLAHRVDPDRVLRVQHITEGLAETRS